LHGDYTLINTETSVKKGLRKGHVIKNIREGQLWFDHPKLCQVPASLSQPKTNGKVYNSCLLITLVVSPGGVAVLGPEGGTKGIDLLTAVAF